MAVRSFDFQHQLQALLPRPAKLYRIRDIVALNSGGGGTPTPTSTPKPKPPCQDQDSVEDRVTLNSSLVSSINSTSSPCPFDCCRKNLGRIDFGNCEVLTTSVNMRIGFEENDVTITPHKQNSNNLSNVNNKQCQRNTLASGSGSDAVGCSVLQKKTLFEGKVPLPMRFDELMKAHAGYGQGGDQEILLMEQDNLKLEFHRGVQSPESPSGTSASASHASQDQNKHIQYNLGRRQNTVDRFDCRRHQLFYPVAANSNTTMSPQSAWNTSQSGHNNGNNFNKNAANKWTSGQMEVIATNNVIHSANGYGMSQNQSAAADCNIPVMEMKPLSITYSTQVNANLAMSQHHQHQPKNHTADFIDQQLNNHLKSFKYIKQSQLPVQPQNQNQGISLASTSAYANSHSHAHLYSSPTSATITKISHSQQNRMPGEGSTSYEMAGSGNGGVSTLSPKSKPNFKHKMQPQPPVSPRAALEHYEKLKKHWDYQHYMLWLGSGGNDCNNYNMTSHEKFHSSSTINYPSYHKQPTTTWQQNQGHPTTHNRGGPVSNDPFDLAYHTNTTPSHPHSYQTYNAHPQLQIHPNSLKITPSGFAVELEKLQNYNYAHGQGGHDNLTRTTWLNKPTFVTPTPAQKKTYPPTSSDTAVPQTSRAQVHKNNEPEESTKQSTKHSEKASITAPMNAARTLQTSDTLPPSSQQRSILNITHSNDGEVEILDCVERPAAKAYPVVENLDKNMPKNGSQFQTTVVKTVVEFNTEKEKPTDLSLHRPVSGQDKRPLVQQSFANKSLSTDFSQRSKSLGGITDVSGYDHIVLLDKRVMTYMCKRCLETLKSDQDIRNHLFCKMLQNSIQCHVCRNLFASDEYQEHLRGHGVRPFSN